MLGILGFLAILVATMPLWQFIPGTQSILLVPFAVIVFVGSLVFTAKPVKAEVQQTDPSPFTPDPNNDKTILIQGWSEAELRQILDDFVEEDLTAFAAFRIELEKHLENSFVLTFPEDIHPAEFVSLVNYLAYPINFGLKEREIVVAGKTTLNSDFDGLARSLEGKKAILYLPQNDEDYDVVYLHTESGMTLAKSFNEGVWRTVKDPRLPSAVESLAW